VTPVLQAALNVLKLPVFLKLISFNNPNSLVFFSKVLRRDDRKTYTELTKTTSIMYPLNLLIIL